MSSLKVGLIGCGRIVQLVHLNVLARLPDAEWVALAEPDPQRREEASRRVPKAIAFSSYQEMLEKSDVEAAVICLPNALPGGRGGFETGQTRLFGKTAGCES